MQKLQQYIKKSIALGPQKTVKVIHNKIATRVTGWYWRNRALQKKAHCSWVWLQKKYALPDIYSFCALLRQQPIPPFSSTFFKTHGDDAALIEQAESLKNSCFELLGSGKQCFTEIPWHTDFRLSQGINAHFNPELYYKEYIITPGLTEECVKDIKIPWELSRFNHFFVLGNAFRITNNPDYAQTFMKHSTDWMEKNQFLLGPNWVCPMDVAIRALNWIWGFYFFKDSLEVPSEFWQPYICMLYDHMIYLENNWEIYDSRTSNHYLSDLIGYFYLCYFFQNLAGMQKKAWWCYQELLKEFYHQIFAEGTSYEGSTAYHGLVTEIFYHFSILCTAFNYPLDEDFMNRFKRMIVFINACTTQQGMLICIGDNDSGKICYPGIKPMLEDKSVNKEMMHYYAEFGLSIIKTSMFHVTLRHHAYTERQPSGHFHSDIGSVTLAIDGIDVLVDPGSYVYTPSAVWRNRFRSVTMHNTFFLTDCQPVPLDNNLFTMALPAAKPVAFNRVYDDRYYAQAEHRLYEKSHGLIASRAVECSQKEKKVIVSDWWQSTRRNQWMNTVPTSWNFMLGQLIEPIYDNGNILLLYNQKPLALIESRYALKICDSFVSYSYGTKVACKKLHANQLAEKEVYSSTFTVL